MTAHDATRDSPVLVISTDPLLAALLGLMVELDGHRLAFTRGTEAPRAALTRTRARLVLVDADHPDGVSDGFLLHARREGAAVVVFGPARALPGLGEKVRQHGLAWLTLPTRGETFARTLADALGPASS